MKERVSEGGNVIADTLQRNRRLYIISSVSLYLCEIENENNVEMKSKG